MPDAQQPAPVLVPVVLEDAREAVSRVRAFPSDLGEMEGRTTEKGARALDGACDAISVALDHLAAAHAACQDYEADGFHDPGRAMDAVRDALGRRGK